MLQLQVIHLLVQEGASLICCRTFAVFHSCRAFHILKQHSDGYWNQVLNCEWRCDGEVAKRDEISLLCVEVDVASDAIRVCIKCKIDLVVIAVYRKVVAGHTWARDHRLLFKNMTFFLQQTHLSHLWPLKLRFLGVHRAGSFTNHGNQRPDLDAFETTCLQWNNHRLLGLNHHAEVQVIFIDECCIAFSELLWFFFLLLLEAFFLRILQL